MKTIIDFYLVAWAVLACDLNRPRVRKVLLLISLLINERLIQCIIYTTITILFSLITKDRNILQSIYCPLINNKMSKNKNKTF